MLDSSKSSKDEKLPNGAATAPGADSGMRRRGHRGGVIPMHRSMARFVLAPSDLITAALLGLGFLFLWLTTLPLICIFWQRVLELGIRLLPLQAQIGVVEPRITPYLHLVIPYPQVITPLPDSRTWCLTAAATALVFAATFVLPKKLIPVIYLSRAILLIQLSSLLYFLLQPAEFPHSCSDYMAGLLTSAVALISAVPVLFGITYYIFDFHLAKKCLLTLMAMAHLAVFVPIQALLHSVVLQVSILFMPVLYVVFGLPLNVLIIIAFYSWGMSWKLKSA